MIKINSDDIRVGHIKQVLSSFNLPKVKIYTEEQARYAELYGAEKNVIGTVNVHSSAEHPNYVYYLKDNMLQCCVITTEQDEHGIVTTVSWRWFKARRPDYQYFYGMKMRNLTKTLKIKNNIYDYYTHEYLGDYLRFKRDHDNLNLMSMYNCFGGRVCESLSYSWSVNPTDDETAHKITFDTSDSGSKIYMLPVKLFQNYTIAIDCSSQVEVCCGIYGKYQDERSKFANLPANTYKKYSNMKFGCPVLYTALNELNDMLTPMAETELAQSECDLKLFIKLPAENDSSIVVLEGDYRGYNDSKVAFLNSGLKRTQNTSIINFNEEDGYYEIEPDLIEVPAEDDKTKKVPVDGTGTKRYQDFSDLKLVSPLQLLRFNTGASYALADRLMEYLAGNVITHEEELPDNLRRLQKVMKGNGIDFDEDGQWHDKMRAELYTSFNNFEKADVNDTNHDILGYVDKDVEKVYSVKLTGNSVEKGTTLMNVDLYTDKNGLYSDLGEDR